MGKVLVIAEKPDAGRNMAKVLKCDNCKDVYIENEKSELFAEVMSLPKKYSIVLHLYYYEDYSVREISRILGISETNVQTRLMRARKKLRVQLKEAWNDEQI